MSTKSEKRRIERNQAKYKRTLEGLIKMTCDNLDTIYKSCKGIATKFGVSYLPAKMLKITLNEAKLSTTTELEVVNTQNTQYNKTLDSLFDSCITISNQMNTENIPLANIKTGIDVIKEQYIKIKE